MLSTGRGPVDKANLDTALETALLALVQRRGVHKRLARIESSGEACLRFST